MPKRKTKIISGASVSGFPRCGNTWLNYIVTVLLGGKEPIEKEIVKSNHKFSAIKNDSKPILIVRDYKECLPRHFGYKKIESKNFQNLSASGYSFSLYIKNLKDYESVKDKTLLIYYEDLLENPSEEILKIGKFLEREKQAFKFLEKYEHHKNESLRIKNLPSYAGTKSGNDLHFHSKNLSQQTLNKLDNYFLEKHTKIFKKYLKRYKN